MTANNATRCSMRVLGFLFVGLCSASILCCSATPSADKTVVSAPNGSKKPNFLVLLVDDMGYGDLSCFGRKNISSPHIDTLARDGVKLTQWLSAGSICTPSRAALQTGRLPRRFGMTANVLPWRVMALPSQPGGFPEEEITVAELLKEQGYRTTLSGKWHLGISNMTHHNVHLPTQHGYDSFLGLPFTNMHACTQGTNESIQFCMVMANNTVVSQPTVYGNLTEMLTNHTIEAMQMSAATKQPFFILMSYIHVHSPLFSSPQFVNVSQGGRFGDNVMELDHSVGRILTELDRLNMAKDTLVILTSDNGPFAEEGYDSCGRTGGLKGSKGQTWEGGIRMPGLARWPGVIPANTTTDVPVSTLDIFPTLVRLGGGQVPTDRPIDGRDLMPVLSNPKNATFQHEYIWHYCGKNVSAARNGRYKFHFFTQIWTSDAKPTELCTQCCPYGPTAFGGQGGTMCDCGVDDVVHHDPPLVFDMTTDMFEDHPLDTSDPALVKEIQQVKAALADHYASVHHAKDQMHTLPWLPLLPCCNGHYPLQDCRCQLYEPGHSYP